MKKFFTILASLIIILLLIAAVAPKDFKIEREIVINQPQSVVFNYLRIQKNSTDWSPWVKMDPAMVQENKGEDGKVGFITAWSGNSEVGSGEQEIINIVPDERIDVELRFTKPMQTVNHAYFITEPAGEKQTRVVWGMTGRTPFPFNLICLFMKKKVGDTFEQGLIDLKLNLEK